MHYKNLRRLRARAYFYHNDYMAEEPWCLYQGRKGY